MATAELAAPQLAKPAQGAPAAAEAPRHEPKIPLAEAIFVGQLLLLLELIDSIPILGPTASFAITQAYFYLKGLKSSFQWALAGVNSAKEVLSALGLGWVPARLLAFIIIVWLDHIPPKIKEVGGKVAIAAAAAGATIATGGAAAPAAGAAVAGAGAAGAGAGTAAGGVAAGTGAGAAAGAAGGTAAGATGAGAAGAGAAGTGAGAGAQGGMGAAEGVAGEAAPEVGEEAFGMEKNWLQQLKEKYMEELPQPEEEKEGEEEEPSEEEVARTIESLEGMHGGETEKKTEGGEEEGQPVGEML